MKKINTRKLVILAMLTALSYILVLLIKFPLIPAASFLEFTPSDVPVVIGGMIFGPLEALIMGIAVSVLELITVSDSGLIGLVMNILSTVAFAIPIAVVYRMKKTNWNAILALIVGVITMTIVMVIFNVLITPLYMKIPDMNVAEIRKMVIGMLLSVFIPFNAIKGVINAIAAFGVYKGIHKFVEKNGYGK